jgi:hypothetical protein
MRRRGSKIGCPRGSSSVEIPRMWVQYCTTDSEGSIRACRKRVNTDTSPALEVDWCVLIKSWSMEIPWSENEPGRPWR